MVKKFPVLPQECPDMSNICMLESDSGSSDSPHVGQRLLFFRMGPPFKNRDSWGSIQDIGGPGGLFTV